MSDPEFPQHRMVSPTGADLAVYTRDAEGTPRGIVHLNHGLAEHAGRYARFAADLSRRGYHVIAHDHRGHGATTARDGAPRRFANEDGWSKVLQDVAAVHVAARERWGGLPIVIFGHSMGSVIAFNYVLRNAQTVAGGAFWNGNMSLGPLKGVMRFVLAVEALLGGGKFATSRTIDALTFKAWNKRFPEGRSDADWLSRDTDEVDAYVADPMCGWAASVSLWRNFLDGVAYAEEDEHLKALPNRLPIHLVGGGDDPASDNGKAVRDLAKRLDQAGQRDVTCHIWDWFRHETINEIDRDKPIAEFCDWLDRVCDTARPGAMPTP
ncbi:alpha/beta hydrolase [Maricaulis sp. CAU 1757]